MTWKSRINIYTGENGTGKSRLLGKIAKEKLAIDAPVIAISTSQNDKFPRRFAKKKYYCMGVRLGRFVAREAIKLSFINKYQSNDDFLSHLMNILNYVKFEPTLGLKIEGLAGNPVVKLNEYFEQNDIKQLKEKNVDPESLERDIYYLMEELAKSQNNTFWLRDKDIVSTVFSGEILSHIIKYEKLFKRAKVFKSLEIYARKNGKTFPITESSSGELSLISAAIFISANLERSGVKNYVLIDEPENSLHPEWQRQYIENLDNLFSYYNIEYHIATHSPMILSGTFKEKDVSVNRFENDVLVKAKNNIKGIEELFLDQFGIVTPKSTALSDRCIDLINNLDWGEISKESALKELDELRNKSFDNTQLQFIDGVRDILISMDDKNA